MTPADVVIENARVLTMDGQHPRAEAVAIQGQRILAVGSRDDIAGLVGPGTRRIDAGGCTVLPGLVESHMHLFSGAFGLRLLQLDGVSGLAAVRDQLRAYAAANPSEGLLLCKGAGYALFGKGIATTRHLLDEALPDRPVLVMAMDHHTAWANTVALDRAGLLHGRDMPVGNEVVMAADGTATGELCEFSAYDPVMQLRTSGGRERLGLIGAEPDPTLTAAQRDDDLQVLREGLKYCASFGFTSIHNMDGNFYQLDLLRTLEDRGELTARVEVPFHLTPEMPLSMLKEASRMHADYRSDRLRSGRVKMFMDGVIDSGTGALIDDYAGRPGWRGDPLHSAERFNAACVDADARGLQISVHAIGDAAVRRVLDGYEAARNANGPRDSRHRIEHIELAHPDDLHRFKDLGVIASMQPPHPPGAMDFPLEPWCGNVGEARWPYAFPLARLRADGVPIAFSSDWSVSDIDPMRGAKAAMTRKRWSDACPDNRSTLHQTLHAYTAGGAYAGFDEERLGMLKAGMLADVVVMDHDLEAMAPEALDQARAAVTICDGAIVWEA